MTRRWWMMATLVLAANGCGGDSKKVHDSGEDKPSKDAGGGDATDSGAGGDTTGGGSGATSGGSSSPKKRILSEASPNCAGDDPMTPGTECIGMVTCGGSLQAPKICPLATHSCCGNGEPREENDNCYVGQDVCKPIESPAVCDGAEDCPDGQICCVTPLSLGKPTIVCRAPDTCDDDSEGTVFCHTDDDCPAGKTCTPALHAPWWGFCG